MSRGLLETPSFLRTYDTTLYLHVKSVLATGADYGMLSLFFRKAKSIFTARTFFENVSLSVAVLYFVHLEKAERLVYNFEEHIVFFLPIVNIS